MPWNNASRRDVLKSIAGTGILSTAALPQLSGLAAALITDPQKNWTYEDLDKDCCTADGIGVKQTLTLSWYHAEWYDSKGWLHDMAISSPGVGRDESGNSYSTIKGHEYEMRAAFPSYSTLDPGIAREYYGNYPNGSTDVLPEWVEIPLDVALGALGPAYAFAVASDNMAEALSPTDGFTVYSDGFKWHRSRSDGWGWTDVSHFQRFDYSTTQDTSPTMGADFSITNSVWSNNRSTEITLDVDIWQDDQPSVYGSGDSQSSTRPLETNPNRMTTEEKEKFGVQPVEPSSGLSRKGEQPTFIATDIPINVTVST